VGHNTEESVIGSGGLLKSVTTGLGLCGGYPATSGHHWHALDTDIQQWFTDGRVPGDPVELRKMAPHGDLAPPKKYDNRLGMHDVFELVANPGAIRSIAIRRLSSSIWSMGAYERTRRRRSTASSSATPRRRTHGAPNCGRSDSRTRVRRDYQRSAQWRPVHPTCA
jgi:hypothetical protein